jgi:glycosyltransferase involved in cell wall biosynthesis
MVHSNVSVIDIGAHIAKKYKIQHIMHLRELDILKGIEPVNKKSIKIINENTVKFIAISNAVKRYWMNIGIDQSKIVVIYNGIYKDIKTSILKKVKKNDKMIKIIFAGSSAPHKGHSDLLNAIEILINKKINNFHVYWYGDVTNYSSYLLTELQKKKLDRYISFLGFNENLFNDMSGYDIGIVCSRAEAFGRITVEYMLSRVFVIASDTGANPEIIDNDITGLLYQQNNSSDLADKMEFIFNNNEKLSEMVDIAYDKALRKFTSEKNAEEIYQLYSSMNINKNT